MAEIFCPTCGKSNPSDLEKCQFCGSRLKPFASSNLDVTPIKPGENPVIRETSEFEKVELTTSDLVHPGVEPTKKNTAALESTLPSWLRSLRKAEDSTEGKSTGDTSPDQHLPLSSSPEVAAESTDDKPDWLPETGKEIPDDEKDVPDWLASLREEKPDSSAQESISLQDRALNTTGSLSAGVADAEWMSRLGGEPKSETPQAIPGGDTQGEPESLDWLDSIGTESAGSSVGDNPATEQDDALHDWLSNLPPSSELDQSVSGEKEKLPDWQEPTQDKFVKPEPTPSSEKESPPDWQEISQENFIEPKPTVSSGMEALPEWQNPPQEKIIEPEPTLGETGSTPVEPETPDWLSHLGSMPIKTEEQSEESVPDWLAALEPKPGPEPVTSSPVPAAEFSPASSEEIPSWLSQYQAEAAAAEQQESKKEQSESTPPSPLSREGTGPLPEWLVGIEKNPSASGATPAIVANEEVSNSGETTGEGFSLEMPDWISKINPELASEKASGGVSEPPTPENLELSELPTWVQAMRPVESVMAETKESPQEKPQVTELTGPLAGLQGVLPVTPGLGTLRKPPAYSAILNVTEGQQRYAAAFEKMITGETQPQAARKTRLTSNRVWRWVITFLLIAAVVAPLLTGISATPASTIRPP
ncbi:MAG: hypothetical protein ACXWNC_02735, partial [Anaerolineales bacterium]